MDTEKILAFYNLCKTTLDLRCFDVLWSQWFDYLPLYPDQLGNIKLDMNKVPFSFVVYREGEITGLISEVYSIIDEKNNPRDIRLYFTNIFTIEMVCNNFTCANGITLEDISNLSLIEGGLTKACGL